MRWFFKNVLARFQKRGPRSHNQAAVGRFRPELMQLEDRCVLSGAVIGPPHILSVPIAEVAINPGDTNVQPTDLAFTYDAPANDPTLFFTESNTHSYGKFDLKTGTLSPAFGYLGVGGRDAFAPKGLVPGYFVDQNHVQHNGVWFAGQHIQYAITAFGTDETQGKLFFEGQSSAAAVAVTPNNAEESSNPALPYVFSFPVDDGDVDPRGPFDVAVGPPSSFGPSTLWYTTDFALGKMDMNTGVLSTVPLSTNPLGITAGPDGNIWFTEPGDGNIGKFDVQTGRVSTFHVGGDPTYITALPQGYLAYTEPTANRIGWISRDGLSSWSVPIPTPNSGPARITADRAGNVWFTEYKAGMIGHLNVLTGWDVTEFTTPTRACGPWGIALDQAGNIWFTEKDAGKLGKLQPPLEGVGASIHVTEGYPSTTLVTVATFSDPEGLEDVSHYSAILDWRAVPQPGDGGASFATTFMIQRDDDTHYSVLANLPTLEAGSGPLGVWIYDRDGNETYVTAQVQVDDAPLTVVQTYPVQATAGVSLKSTTLLRFADAGGIGAPGDYKVYIVWGDGSPGDDTTGVVSVTTAQGREIALVQGSHVYSHPGTYTVDIFERDNGGSLLEAATTVNVKPQTSRANGLLHGGLGLGPASQEPLERLMPNDYALLTFDSASGRTMAQPAKVPTTAETAAEARGQAPRSFEANGLTAGGDPTGLVAPRGPTSRSAILLLSTPSEDLFRLSDEGTWHFVNDPPTTPPSRRPGGSGGSATG
jgi:streptogramin lyase